MRLSSKGLGKVTLPFRLAEGRISSAAECLVLEGVIREGKVNWTYRAELEDGDILAFVLLARRRKMVTYLAERLGARLFVHLARAMLRLLSWPFRRKSVQAGAAVEHALAESKEEP
ncbi:MAG: hypothetical protein HYZ28_02810 [Myxococcales bacterium]|nr:hypothetical protein [Myxococcales bacterium]